MSRRNGYGRKGGTSATAGKKAAVYEVTVNGQVVKKRWFPPTGTEAPATAVATGFMHDGKPCVCVWPDRDPPWEGDFGRLTATRVG